MTEIPEFIKKIAEKTGFRRERYVEKNMPTSHDNIAVILFYGDMRSEFVMSTLLLHRLKDLYASKYLILCSWSGHAGLYPYVDEYWSPIDEGLINSLANGAIGFDNQEKDKVLFQERQLNRYLENVIKLDDKYYDHGFTKVFFDDFKWIVYNLPSIPSSKIEFNRLLAQKSGYKVLLHPVKYSRSWRQGRESLVKLPIEFWYNLVNKLCDKGFSPIVYQDYFTYDISPELEGKCVYVTGDIMEALAAMRTTGCVLDVFSGVSRWASVARTPFVACAERRLYNEVKEYELDCLCNGNLPFKYIFYFPTLIEAGHWNELISNVVSKLEEFIPSLDRDKFPSTAESSVVCPYSLVKVKKQKKLGTKFIKVERL